ncbi:serine/threonine protein kinase [Xylaria digitata]|nr:serine/threonine protein kinase [Xylaria digitata]
MAELAIGIAGLAIGIPGLIQVTLSLGDAIRRRLVHYEDDFKRLLDIVIRINKSQTQDMLLYFFTEDEAVPTELQDELIEMFQALRDIFEKLLMMFPDSGPLGNSGNKTKITPALKVKAEEKVKALEEWNDRFFKRALVFVMFGRRKLPKTTDENENSEDEYGVVALKKVERLRDTIHESLEGAKKGTRLLLDQPETADDRTPLPNSALQLSTRNDTKQTFLVEYRTYSDDAREWEIKNHRRVVREIAVILHHADTRLMGILHCDGFLWDSLSNRFELKFPFPEGLSKPRTLLDLLQDPENRRSGVKHPLNQRVSLAKRIVKAVFVLHAAGFVHKQIRPDNVVIFERVSTHNPTGTQGAAERTKYPYALGEPFLVGFDSVRKVDAASLMLPVEDWKKSIYLSPERHRLQQGDEFQMHHDIFSLGVLLLEMAFWASFQDKGSQLGKRVWKDGSALRSPGELKSIYLSLASGAVPRLMGQKYADVVSACLTGLQSEGRSAKDLEDGDGIVVGTKYVTAIIKKLEEISI